MSRRTEKLEHDVIQSRERLVATLEEFRSRIQPSNLRLEGSEYLKNTRVGQFMTNLKADVLGHPMPLAILGLAVAWLASVDRSTQRSTSIGRYVTAFRWRARRLTQAVQQNASQAANTVQTTKAAAGELQQRATNVSKNFAGKLSRTPAQVRDLGQAVTKATTVRANAVVDVARAQPIIVGAAAAGLVASAVALTMFYRRYANEVDAASSLVRSSERDAENQPESTMLSVEEPHATLIPQDAPTADARLSSAAGEERRPGFVE